MNGKSETNSILGWLERLSPWAFTGVLYLLRWAVIIPLGIILRILGATGGNIRANGSPEMLLFSWIFLSPLVETALECSVPYWLMRKTGHAQDGKRPWGFVATSATIMAVLHFEGWPAAILPSLATGGFLAYTYGHFAASNWKKAMLHTWSFHAAINIVGWSMAVF